MPVESNGNLWKRGAFAATKLPTILVSYDPVCEAKGTAIRFAQCLRFAAIIGIMSNGASNRIL